MSLVTGVTFMCALSESHDDHGEDLCAVLQGIVEADPSVSKGSASFAAVDHAYGGWKHPEQLVLGSGVNYLGPVAREGLERFVREMPWLFPEKVLLVLSRHEDPLVMIRPGG